MGQKARVFTLPLSPVLSRHCASPLSVTLSRPSKLRYDPCPVPLMRWQSRHWQSLISGTGHGSYLSFEGRDKVTLSGEAQCRDTTGDSGNVKTRAFCPTCGSPVYMTFAAVPDQFIVHAASLDDPGRYRPQLVTYTASGHAWDQLDPTLPKFDRMPPG